MALDENHELHHDAAGWVLGALDPGDAAAFEAHLQDCSECQVSVAEFEATARALKSAAPAVEPPPDLETKTLAAVQLAVIEAKGASAASAVSPTVVSPTVQMSVPGQAAPTVASVRQAVDEAQAPERTSEPPTARMSRWWHWHWNLPLFSLSALAGAAAAAVAAIVIVPLISPAGVGVTAAKASVITQLVSTPEGKPFYKPHQISSGVAVARPAGESWTFELTVRGLSTLPEGVVYECWWSRPGSNKFHPKLASGGSFIVGDSGSTTLTMTTGVNPHQFMRMKITVQHPSDGHVQGPTVLVGVGRTQ
jgi:anti-sigma factor RsiW